MKVIGQMASPQKKVPNITKTSIRYMKVFFRWKLTSKQVSSDKLRFVFINNYLIRFLISYAFLSLINVISVI